MDELDKMMDSMPDTQRQLLNLTGVAWSPDRMVRAEVGPRGQLVDLDIDTRVFRNPDAQALKESIMGAIQDATRKVGEQAAELIDEQIPPEVGELRAQFDPDGADPMAQLMLSDAELVRRKRQGDG